MRSREITLGRKASGVNVDVDLSLEGPAWKISRRQVSDANLYSLTSEQLHKL